MGNKWNNRWFQLKKLLNSYSFIHLECIIWVIEKMLFLPLLNYLEIAMSSR